MSDGQHTQAEANAGPPRQSPRVFIVYSQHDAAHSERVLEFARALINDGVNADLDQFHQHELVDWPRWCEERLRPENSDYVLMVCSAEYRRRIEERLPSDKGRGVYWEGSLIDDYLYDSKANERFIPVLFDDEPETSTPRIVSGWSRVRIRAFGLDRGDAGYLHLLHLLTGQPVAARPPLGRLPVLPTKVPAGAPGTPAPPASLNNLLYPSLGDLFKGRDAFLQGIRAGFAREPGRAQAIVPRQAIHGLGGIGKTRAAIEYAWRFAGDYTALLFAPAETAARFRQSLAGLCDLLKIAPGVTDDNVRFDAALRWLADRAHDGWLLLVDNVDTPEAAAAVDRALAPLNGGHVLITGRLDDWPPHVDARRLDVLDPDAATQFLLARTEGRRDARTDDPKQARALAGELDGLALALEQAAAFIRHHALSFAEYRRRWLAADRQVQEWHDPRIMLYPRSLAACWQATMDRLPPAARALLHLLSWLAPDPLPRFLFDPESAPEGLHALFEDREASRRVLRDLSGDAAAEPEAALAALREVSLIQPARGADFPNAGQLHRVLAAITRDRQSDAGQARSLPAALALLNAAAVGDPQDVRHWPVWEPLRPHVLAAVAFADQRGIAEPTATLMNDLGLLLHARAQYAEAEPLMRRALAINEESFGPEHPNVAIRLNNLAALLQATNRLAEAEPLMRRALAIEEGSFGPEHPNVAIHLNNLAQLLQATNRLAEAEPLMRRVVSVVEKSLGQDHPNVATALNNLAALLKATNRLAEAEPLMRRVVVILLAFTRSTGYAHPHLRTAFGNYAAILQAMSLSRQEMARRVASVGSEAGFDAESYRRLRAAVLG
ncbi:MAG: tetratricopeptide repeat protein [Armatimonadetes bacterium]|nr:tetratricopeptide repeat protein [Armatimonadota bacterium]